MLVSYLAARYINRNKPDKKKRVFPGKFVYLTSANPWGEPKGTIRSVRVLLKEHGWRGDMTGIVEAPELDDVRNWVKKTYNIESFVLPETVNQELKYKSLRLDLISGMSEVSDRIFDTYEEALERSLIETIRENKRNS